MNISSFNVTDVGYHYIGLRVLGAMPEASRDEQTETIARSVAKYMRDKALRLMLPEPKSAYETVGEKVCQELAHFDYADAKKGKGYELTATGQETLGLLNDKEHVALRRRMALIHLKTYANLQAVVHVHIAHGGLLNPVVEGTKINAEYVAELLRPSFGKVAEDTTQTVMRNAKDCTPKQLEDALRETVLQHLIPQHSIGVPLFRSMTDRLITLRLLNSEKVPRGNVEFFRTYSPCVESPPLRRWHHEVRTALSGGGVYTIYLSEPNFDDDETRAALVEALNQAYAKLPEKAGYFDLPDVRDFVCNYLSIPEAAFDEGVLALLEPPQAAVTLGLTYEGISGRRKPLVRFGESTQIYNLIRSA